MNANHPGNVLTTISDRKKHLPGTTPAFEAVIETAQDYYPFGSLMPGRKYNAGEYRFGFNGQEKDDEIAGVTGSHTTALFWEYDTRLGRRWNVDPNTFHSISSYACFNGNPILHNDPLGDIWDVSTDKETQSDVRGIAKGKNHKYITINDHGRVGLDFGKKKPRRIEKLLAKDEGLKLASDLINANDNAGDDLYFYYSNSPNGAINKKTGLVPPLARACSSCLINLVAFT